MPHVSKRIVDKKLERILLENLDLAFGKLSKEETKSFLYSLFSPTEKVMLAKRLGIIILLKQGYSPTQISSRLCVTLETVARTNVSYERKSKGYDIALKKLLNEVIMKEFKKLLGKVAEYSIRATTGYIKI